MTWRPPNWSSRPVASRTTCWWPEMRHRSSALASGCGRKCSAVSACSRSRRVGRSWVLVGGFALAPVMRLRRVPPLKALRRELAAWPDEPTLALYAVAGATFFGLLIWLASDLRLAIVTAGGFAAAALLFAGGAWVWLRALRILRGRVGPLPASLSFALAAIGRRPAATIIQVVALSFGLTALLVMAMGRADLLHQWQTQIPPDAPNHFIINIQPDQA